jgi:voltage-gated potassium channel
MLYAQFLEVVDFIIEPKNKTPQSQIYDRVMLVAIICGILPLMFREQNTLFRVLDIASCACFIVDYLLRWMAYAVHRPNKSILMSYLLYPVTPMAIIDLLSILPTFTLLTPTLKIARLSRLLKLLRVIKFVRYFEPLGIILAVIRKQRAILWTVFTLALFYTFITAMIMFNAEETINPNTGQPLFDNFFDAFYWAVCTLTTVGYGDLYPISTTGRIISIISSMVGIAIVALPSGIITAGYLDELKERKEKDLD